MKYTPQIRGKAIQELKRRKLADFTELRIGKTNYLLMRLTQKGYELLHLKPPRGVGRGGIAHQHVSKWIAMVGKKRGYKAYTEWVVPNTSHPVDAVWIINGIARVFEVVITAEDNLESHIKACFEDSDAVESLTIVVPQMQIRDRLRKQLESSSLFIPHADRIQFEVVKTFLKELWP